MDRIFLDLGFFQISWYSIFVFFGFLLGGFFVLKEARRFKIPDAFVSDLFFDLVIVSILGARLYYVIFNFSYYKDNLIDILKIWEGGLAIHGGLLAGLLFLLYYCHKAKAPATKILDMIVVGLILGQAIGRWGNFFNQEAFGPATTLEHLQNMHLPDFIINGMEIQGVYHIPTFLYESIWCFLGFIILLIIRRLPYTKNGNMLAFYLVWYGIERFVVEGMRMDSLMLGNIRMAQLVSIVMVVAGIFVFIRNHKFSPFENNYKDPIDVDKIRV